MFVISGFGDLWGCGCRFHSRGMGVAEARAEDSVPEGDAGELPEPGIAR